MAMEVPGQKRVCRYALVVAAAKRARQLIAGEEPLVKTVAEKPVLIALREVQADKVRWYSRKAGIK